MSRTDCRGDDGDGGDEGGTDFCCPLSSLSADLMGTGETDACIEKLESDPVPEMGLRGAAD